MKVNTIIVNGKKKVIADLKAMLYEIDKNIQVTAIATSILQAKGLILELKPDLVFLDLEMPKKNGFQLLEHFPKPDFEVIFTTVSSQYTAKAFRISSIDFLFKPLKKEELKETLQQVAQKNRLTQIHTALKDSKENIANSFHKLALPIKDGFVFIKPETIIRCEAQGNYTMFFLEEEKKILVSKTLKIFDDVLREVNFFRINRSHLINLKHVYRYNRHKSPTVILSDGSELPIAEARKHDFLGLFEGV